MTISNSTNVHFQKNLEVFEKAAGNMNDVGYITQDKNNKLTNVATHETLTKSDKQALGALRGKFDANLNLRRTLFESIKASLSNSMRDTESTAQMRLETLRFAARKLGIVADFTGNDVNEGVNMLHISSQPLSRRDVRTVLNVVNCKSFQLSILGERGAETPVADHRKCLVDAMRKDYSGFEWKGLQLEKLSTASLEALTKHLLEGEIFDSDNLRNVVATYAEGDPMRLDSSEKASPSKTREGVVHRECFIAEMKANHPEFNWSAVMLSRVSDEGIENISDMIDVREVRTDAELQDLVSRSPQPRTEPGTKPTVASLLRCDAMVSEMKANFPQFAWDKVPLERLSAHSLEKLADHLVNGDFTDSVMLRRAAVDFANMDFESQIALKDGDDVRGVDSSARREELIQALKTHVSGINWSQLPLGKLSNKSLATLSQEILRGGITTMDQLKNRALDLAAADSSAQKINDETVLQRLEHSKGRADNKVTFSPAKKKSGVEEKLIYEQKEFKSEPFLAPKAEDPDWFDKEGNRVTLEQYNALKEKALSIPTEESLSGTGMLAQIGRVGKYGQLLHPGKAEMVVDHFLQEFIEASGRDNTSMLDVIMQHKRAVVLLSVAPDDRFDAIFKAIPNGKLFKGAFAQMREVAKEYIEDAKKKLGMNPTVAMIAAGMHEKLLDMQNAPDDLRVLEKKLADPDLDAEEFDILLEQKSDLEDLRNSLETMVSNANTARGLLRDELKTKAGLAIDSTVKDETRLKKTFEDFRKDLGTYLKDDANSADPNAFLFGLLAVARKHCEALTILLTHTDKALPLMGGEAVLKPVIDNLKAKINGDMLQKFIAANQAPFQGLKPEDKIDLFRPEFAGRVFDEVNGMISSRIEDFVLDPVDEVQAVLFKAAVKAVKGALLGVPTIEGESIAQTHANLGNVTEQNVRNTLADLVLEVETWNTDEETVPGERMQTMVTKNLDTLAVILCNPERCAKMLGLPGTVEGMVKSFRENLGAMAAFLSPGNEAIARIMLGNAVKNMKVENFAAIQKGVDQAVREGMNIIQSITANAFEALIKGENIGDFGAIMDAIEAEKEQIAQWKAFGNNTDDPKVLGPLLKEYRDDVSFKNSLKGLPEDRKAELTRRRAEDAVFQSQLKALDPVADKDRYEGIKTQYKAIRETRFTEDLSKMTLAEGAELWAKHNFYFKDSRTRFVDKLTKELGADAMKSMKIGDFIKSKNVPSFSKYADDFIRENNIQMKKFKDPELMTDQERSVLRLQESTLDEIAGKGALDTNTGYGKFMVEVMKNYFNKVTDIDMKSMLSSLIRQGKVNDIPEGATQAEVDAITKDNIARQLGALFKGAGPVMQKLLQQLGSTEIADSFKLALDDMKSNLLPIPKEIVEAQLQSIVERYNDPTHLANPNDPAHPLSPITNINVDKSLGAASVGQTLLCTVTCEDGSSRKVAIKLLRPDAQNRIEREKDIFLDVARQIPGMERTYLGRLERILEEVDLTIEASNVQKGEVYDKDLVIEKNVNKKTEKTTYKDVHSMKLDKGIETTRDIMALECAPGKTVADLLSENDAKLRQMRIDLEKMSDPTTRSQVVSELTEMLNMLYPKALQLAHLSHKWVEEGLFKTGFYHGDLHAGNIMVDTEKADGVDKGLTVIDFGNATSLSKEDQGCIMRMVYGAQSGNADLFLDNYRTLMDPSGHARFDVVRKDAKALLKVIFGKGKDSDAGQRILGAVTELQKLGLELPAPIFNFSQCQILLQGTLEQVSSQLSAMTELHDTLKDTREKEQGTLSKKGHYAQVISEIAKDSKSTQQLLNLWDRKAEGYLAKQFKQIKTMRAMPESAHFITDIFGDEAPTLEALRKPEIQQKMLDVLPRADKEAFALIAFADALLTLAALRTKVEIPPAGPGEEAPMSAVQKYRAINDQVQAIDREIDDLQKQIDHIDLTVPAMGKVSKDVILSPDNLEIRNPVVFDHVKECKTKEAMLGKLASDMEAIRNKTKQTDKDRTEFEALSAFKKALEKTPAGYLPRLALQNVRKAIENVPGFEEIPNNVKDITYAINQKLNAFKAEDTRYSSQPLAGYITEVKGRLPIDTLFQSFREMKTTVIEDGVSKEVHLGWKHPFPREVIQANYKVLKSMSECAFPNPKDNKFLQALPTENAEKSLTKSEFCQLVRDIQSALLNMKTDAKECKTYIERLQDAKKELDTYTKQWPEKTLVLSLPKLTDEELQTVGEPFTPENISQKLAAKKIELEQSKEEAGTRLADVRQQLADDENFREITPLCDKFYLAESLLGMDMGILQTNETPSFLDIMGNVINDHKLQAAKQVGFLTAAKEVLFG